MLAAVAAVAANGVAAEPAAAIDCWPFDRAAPARHAAPHRPVKHVRKARPARVQKASVQRKKRPGVHKAAHRPKKPAAVAAPTQRAMMVRPGYSRISALPEEACDKTPRLMSLLPGAAPERGASGILEDVLAPPPPAALEDLGNPELPPATLTESNETFPGNPGGFFPPGDTFFPGVPGSPPAGPGVPPSVTPPGLPPEVLPPGTVLPPDTVLPPGTVTPPGTELPPVIVPPGGPGLPPIVVVENPPPTVLPPGIDVPPVVIPPGTPTAVPEPTTWAMLILGFFGTGAAIRSRRRRAARA